MSEDRKQITYEMTIEEIFSRFPHKSQKLAQEITNTGLHCVGCQAATWETLETGMLGHGFTVDQIEGLLNRLNDILNEEVDLETIGLTKRAAEKFKQILADESKTNYGLRFADKAAGCSGFEYVLDYSEEAKTDDQTFHSHGVEIHVNEKMVKRLLGSEIDFVDGLNGSGFKVSNPNVKGSCGCGKSQSY